MNKITILGPKDISPTNAATNPFIINCCSNSRTWSKELSPFILGPVDLYAGWRAKNVENGWQYSKVYSKFLDKHGRPSKEYFDWATEGWAKIKAVRYPMGKGSKPEYCYWNGEKLDYIESRKKVYIPLYCNALFRSEAFDRLKEIYAKEDITLWDFDGYDYQSKGLSHLDAINNPSKKLGHALVIAFALQNLVDRYGDINV